MTAAPTGTATPAQLAARRDKVAADLQALRDELKAEAAPQVRKVPAAAQTEDEPTKERDAYRPTSLDDLIGQRKLLMQLRVVLHGARLRGDPIAHTLLSGPPGTGKSSLAAIIADEIGAELIQTTGMVLKRPEDIAAILVQATGPSVLFVDEIHRLPVRCSELLYGVMEDGVIDLVAQGDATRHKLPEITVIGATTAPGLLDQPFRDRFGAQLVMDEYEDSEIAAIAARVWDRKGTKYAKGEASELAKRSRGVPRRAVTFATRVLDVAAVKGLDKIETGTVAESLAMFGVDENGLTAVDYKILYALTKTFGGRPVGISAIASLLDMEESTIQENHEPYLCRRGFMIRTRSGRIATRAAYELVQEAA